MNPAPALSETKVAPARSASATRDKILRAATPLFEAGGVHGTTIRQDAAAADVNRQLIYYYFSDKEGLFRAVLESVAARVSDLLADAAQGTGTRVSGSLLHRCLGDRDHH